jgi:hypothetical protein
MRSIGDRHGVLLAEVLKYDGREGVKEREREKRPERN